jgi:molecular chaperone GrpE
MAAKKKIKIMTKNEDTETEKITVQEKDSDTKDTEKTEDPLQEMETRLESLEQEAKDSYDRFLRVSAEFENYKKRAVREMDDFRKFANENFVKAMLPVIDNLDRAIETSSSNEQTIGSVVEGVSMTLKEILKVFEQFNVKAFDSLGKTFDPNFHQAVMQEETEDHPENTVIHELQKGYMMHDRLIRPAMVVVSKTKADPESLEHDDLEEQK